MYSLRRGLYHHIMHKSYIGEDLADDSCEFNAVCEVITHLCTKFLAGEAVLLDSMFKIYCQSLQENFVRYSDIEKHKKSITQFLDSLLNLLGGKLCQSEIEGFPDHGILLYWIDNIILTSPYI